MPKRVKKSLKRALKKNVLVKGTKGILDKTEIDDILIAKARSVQREIRKHIITAITAALAFVIALFWRDAIQTGINEFLEKVNISTDTYIYKILAAVVITIICVFGILFVARLEKKD